MGRPAGRPELLSCSLFLKMSDSLPTRFL